MYLYLFSYIQDKGYEPDSVLNFVTSAGSGFTDLTAGVFVLFSYIQDKGYEPDAVLNYVTSVGSGFTDSTADVFVFIFLYSG